MNGCSCAFAPGYALWEILLTLSVRTLVSPQPILSYFSSRALHGAHPPSSTMIFLSVHMLSPLMFLLVFGLHFHICSLMVFILPHSKVLATASTFSMSHVDRNNHFTFVLSGFSIPRHIQWVSWSVISPRD